MTQAADVEGFAGVFRPLGMAMSAEVVFVIGEEFFEACAGHVGELELGFGGGAGGFRAFEDVLFYRSARPAAFGRWCGRLWQESAP